jgi:hypothetical protein
MKGETRERWLELCEQATLEQDIEDRRGDQPGTSPETIPVNPIH